MPALIAAWETFGCDPDDATKFKIEQYADTAGSAAAGKSGRATTTP